MNIFSSDEFLQTTGELFFPGHRPGIELREVEGRVLRLLVLDGRTVVRDSPYYDFPQPLDSPPDEDFKPLGYFPRTVVRTIAAGAPVAAGCAPSPFIRWADVGDLLAFERRTEAQGARLADSRRQRRRLEQELGPLRFTFDDREADAFEACVRWKAAQYTASGFTNLFAQPACVGLFQRLQERGVVVVSSLRAGGRLLASHLGGLFDGQFSWWVPAYDQAFSKYSPGRLLLEDAMRASHALGHREFDFLLGDEKYKYLYATHTRVIGPLGVPPLLERIEQRARARVKQLLVEHPSMKQLVSRLRRRGPVPA